MTLPSTPSTLEILANLATAGFEANLIPTDQGVRVSGQTQVVPPDEVTVHVARRVEGMSNPDDLAMVYGIEMPDGTRGALVLAYGPGASSADATLMKQLPESRRS